LAFSEIQTERDTHIDRDIEVYEREREREREREELTCYLEGISSLEGTIA
jgi:hypothetical protein